MTKKAIYQAGSSQAQALAMDGFSLSRPGKNSPHTMSWALQEWNDDCVLMDYDATTGKGRFVIVDWYAPAPGTVIELQLDMNLEELDPGDEEWFD
ncbi:hypothetical protein HB4184_01850 [Pseudomonas putida]|nr:hypothetical protein HB4184_01850 [Pseudomonas putida]